MQKENVADTQYSKRELLVEMVRKWGGPTSDAVLDPSISHFEHPTIQGFVGYRIISNCAAIFGDPVCALEDRAELALAFHHFMEEKKISTAYISASQSYAHWAIDHVCGAIIEYGAEFFFDKPTDPRKGSGSYASLVRRKIKRAIKENVTVQEYIAQDSAIESGIEKVKELWLAGRRGLQVHISNVYLFEDCLGKRWFYASQGDQIVGVIVLNQLQAHNGWLLNHLMVVPGAPSGISEYLIATAFETLEKEGCSFITVGSVAGSKLGEIRGLSRFSQFFSHLIFRLASKLVGLERLNTFWGKFEPKMAPAYLLFGRKRIGFRELKCLREAMNGTTRVSKVGGF
jgi:lysylphosphatidylglycerol synthetase-like protein (DUF2156 family)